MFDTPVLFLIYNRPDLTKISFSAIQKIKPRKLYIAGDGPKINKINDDTNCIKARSIINLIEWNCEIKTLFRDTNLGCKIAVSTAIDWFFSHEKEGIIIEDDCKVDISFFRFANELLVKYNNNNKIGMISAINYCKANNITISDNSYIFSKYPHIWGWATWADRWKKYDVSISDWPKLSNNKSLKNSFDNNLEYRLWEERFDSVFNNKIDTWDIQWAYCMFKNNLISIIPKNNLVENIGFNRSDATHTISKNPFSDLTLESVCYPMIHPKLIEVNKIYDDFEKNKVWNINIINFFKFYLKKLLNF